jgi:hypothetical protein
MDYGRGKKKDISGPSDTPYENGCFEFDMFASSFFLIFLFLIFFF